MDHPNLVIVQTYGSRPEADMAKGALESAGIPAMFQADTAGGMREHLAWSGPGFHIFVREEDLLAAREILTPPTEGDQFLDPEFSEHNIIPPSSRRSSWAGLALIYSLT
jgi:hypothetical protein